METTKFSHIEVNHTYTGVYILHDVISDENRKKLIEYTEKYALSNKTDYSDEARNNVRCYAADIKSIENNQNYNEIRSIIHETMTDVQELLKKHIDVHIMAYETPCLRKIYGATRTHTDGLRSEITTKNTLGSLYDPTEDNLGSMFSVIVALNDDYEGGEFVFPKHDFSVRLQAGDAIAFPPYWTHPHQTNDLNGTFRYTINTWFHGNKRKEVTPPELSNFHQVKLDAVPNQ